MEDNIHNTSWTVITEIELNTTMLKCNNPKVAFTIKQVNDTVDIDDIFSLDIETLSEYELVKKETLVTVFIKNYLKSCCSKSVIFNPDMILLKLIWLSKVSGKLSTQGSVRHKKKEKGIARNSYNFCPKGSECKYKYSKKKIKGECFSQHFVHHLVKSDIDELIDHITENGVNTDITESLKSINTINYVIVHMNDELMEANRINYATR